ncbi:hypothetical protein NDU88_005731 [Pleurodeles waltl]|uniref:Uncharacterized protein n=1 Tax=Pleurodeles waltl TaxID=8319 RepID=A0AAV7PGF4_PLEWA|nr:hypothetical protein NDU88_005731 [Pleurodeles waltl]
MGAIKLADRTLVTSQAAFNGAFRDYYNTLYQADLATPAIGIVPEHCSPGKASPLQRAALDEFLQPEEIRPPISQITRIKPLGTHGLQLEYYATYSAHLVQPLLEVFMEAWTLGGASWLVM